MNATPFNHARHDNVPSLLNGSNGHTPKFRIEAYEENPFTPEQRQAVLEVRRRVAHWPLRKNGRQGISSAEKHFFDWLLDRAVDRRTCYEGQRGFLLCTATFAASLLHVHPDTVRRWRDSLERVTGEIWVTGVPQPNMWEWDLYHITALCAKPSEYRRSQLGMVTVGKNRGQPRIGSGNIGNRQQKLPLKVEKLQVLDSPGVATDSCRATLGTDAEPRSANLPSHARQEYRATLGTDAEPRSASLPSHARQEYRATLGTEVEHKRVSSIQSFKPSEEGVGNPPGLADSEAWIKLLDGAHLSRLQKIEADFLAELRKARSDSAKGEWRRRLGIVRERIHGPKVPDAPEPAAVLAPAPISKATPQEISSLIEQAKKAVEDAPTQQRTKGRQ